MSASFAGLINARSAFRGTSLSAHGRVTTQPTSCSSRSRMNELARVWQCAGLYVLEDLVYVGM